MDDPQAPPDPPPEPAAAAAVDVVPEKRPATDGLGKLLKLGIPLVLGMGGHAFFNLVDLAMVGGYESDPAAAEATLSGITIASLIATLPLIFMNGVTNGTVPVIARAYGARKIRRANQAARQALLLCVGLSVLLGVVPGIFAEEISLAFEAQAGIELNVSTEYLRVVSIHAWSGFLLMQITSNMRAIGMGLWPMVLLLTSNVGNIVGNYLLIFGKFGFPELGAPGAAYATVIARGVAVACGLFVLMRCHPAIRISAGGWRPRLRFLAQLTKSGLPVALQWTLRTASVLFVLYLIAEFGASAKAAFGIGNRLDMLALFAGFGWGGACAALLAHRVARGDIAGARRVTTQSAWLNVITMSAAGACFWLFPDALIRVFSLGVSAESEFAAVVEQGTRYLRIGVLSYPGFALSVVWSHALNGAGSVKTPLLIDTLGLFLCQFPLVWALKNSSLGIDGAWWGLVISHSIIALVYYLVFRAGAWEKKKAL